MELHTISRRCFSRSCHQTPPPPLKSDLSCLVPSSSQYKSIIRKPKSYTNQPLVFWRLIVRKLLLRFFEICFLFAKKNVTIPERSFNSKMSEKCNTIILPEMKSRALLENTLELRFLSPHLSRRNLKMRYIMDEVENVLFI